MNMKKFIINCLAFLMVMVGVASFSACSKDGDGNLETPKYESVSAKYDITSANSHIKSIELTASGNYIIVRNNVVNTKVNYVPMFIAKLENATRSDDWYNNIIQGKFTMISDTEFQLEGFGTITIIEGSGSAVSLQIAPVNSTPYTLEAEKKEQNPESAKTNKLCRSWGFDAFYMKIGVKLENRNYTLIDGKYKWTEEDKFRNDVKNAYVNIIKKMAQDQGYSIGSEEMRQIEAYAEQMAKDISFGENRPEKVIFTKAGTYMVVYHDSSLAIATWTWENENDGKLRYSWDYNDMGNDAGNISTAYGIVNVEFSGSQLVLSESVSNINEYITSFTMKYYMSEIK